MQNKKHLFSLTTLVLSSILLIAACTPAAPAVPTADPEALLTQAAATVAVQLTQRAALTPSPLPPTATTAPTNTQPPPAVQPTLPPAATNTPAPTSAPAQGKDAGSFVSDVTIPDGTGAAPGVVFDKVWRIKNTGETTWTTSYTLNWVDGDKMGAPDSVSMPNDVRPGETVDITIKLTAPAKAGSYQTFFRLRNADGQFFRLDGSGDLWVKISVGGVSPTPDLTETAKAPTAEPTATSAP